MKDTRKLPWTRLILSLAGIGVILLCWRWAVNHLYSLPDPALPVFQSITNNAFYTIAALLIFAITGKLVWDWKNSTASTAEAAIEVIREKREEKSVQVDERIVREMAARYADDPSYRPLETLPDTDAEVFR
jgi:hypothetical protein